MCPSTKYYMLNTLLSNHTQLSYCMAAESTVFATTQICCGLKSTHYISSYCSSYQVFTHHTGEKALEMASLSTFQPATHDMHQSYTHTGNHDRIASTVTKLWA